MQADQIEDIRMRVIRITHNMPYVSATFVADLPTMSDRRDQLCRKFFSSTLQPTSPLHSLLPSPRDQLPITRLWAASKFPRIPTRTKKSVLSLVCPSPLSDLTISSRNHYQAHREGGSRGKCPGVLRGPPQKSLSWCEKRWKRAGRNGEVKNCSSDTVWLTVFNLLIFWGGPPGPLRTPGPRLQLPSGIQDLPHAAGKLG